MTPYDALLDVDVQAVPPRWPPSAQNLVVEDGVYDLNNVPVTSIALVTGRILKVKAVATRCSTSSPIGIDRCRSNIRTQVEVAHDGCSCTTWGPCQGVG
jgi:hypothetical protein